MSGARWSVVAAAALLAGIAAVTLPSCAKPEPEAAAGRATGEVTVSAPEGPSVGQVQVSEVLAPEVVTTVKKPLENLEGLQVTLAYSPKGAQILSPVDDTWRSMAGTVKWPDATVGYSPNWTKPGQAGTPFPDAARLTRLASTFVAVDRRYKQFAKADTRPSPDDLHGLVTDYKRLVTEAYDAAHAAREPAQKESFIRLAVDSQRQLQSGMLMAYEAGLRRPPQFYRNVGVESRATVALTRLGTVLGTGFLVSREWVITNRHVVAGILDLRSSTTVEFDREDPASPPSAADRSCDIVEARIADGQSGLDLAAIRFRCKPGVPGSWDGRVLTLAARDAALDEGVYVVGHPFNGTKLVVDNAFVRYPYRVSDETHTGLRRFMSGASDRAYFDRFYQKCDATSGDWCYRSAASRWDNTVGADDTANIPTLGFDSNTAPGNSGSPVISVSEQTVLGVFFGGSRDWNVAGKWSFSRHEAAIPSALIIEWLQSAGVTLR